MVSDPSLVCHISGFSSLLGMRDKDIKILWGRSGNRCAICKLELTPDGSRETLGEMAHILARSPDGPRGLPQMETVSRDSYENLILLCPNHHLEVDKVPDNWSADRLIDAKTQHEKWVSERLQAGQISVLPVDNSAFLESRRQAWVALSRGQVAMVVSVSPLQVSRETLDPMDSRVLALLDSVKIPTGRGRERGTVVNRYNTRPTQNGTVNEDFRDTIEGFCHSIQIFRVGHCEYFCDLGRFVEQITKAVKERQVDLRGASRVIRYTDVAEVAEFGLLWLWDVWTDLLPYNYMTLTVRLINTRDTILFSREERFCVGIFGFPVTEGGLEYSEVVARDTSVAEVLLSSLRRLSNAYGLVLNEVHDSNREYIKPEKMR